MMKYQEFGTATLAELWDDLVVYRDLEPADTRLPGWRELRRTLGLREPFPPRKAEPAYGRVVAEILRHARRLERPRGRIRRLLYVGDTAMNDGGAFRALCAGGDWPGLCFIGCDAPAEPPRAELRESVCTANRWSALQGFADTLQRLGFPLDEATAVVIDLDKTALGARGRNDAVIDRVRLEAAQGTLAGFLGPACDETAFAAAYAELNRPRWHPFTGDNQDFVTYLCLLAVAGLCDLERLAPAGGDGTGPSFDRFLAEIDSRREELARAGLASLHDRFRDRVRRGDSTPFGEFRRAEYAITAARFGAENHPWSTGGEGRNGDDGGAADPLPSGEAGGIGHLLESRIVITEEVRALAEGARRLGALVFGLSDKPREAAWPAAREETGGQLPLHRLPTLSVGEAAVH